MAPRSLAEQLIGALPQSDLVERAEVAGPGFINFHLAKGWLGSTVRGHRASTARTSGGARPRTERILIEFVSANPTGPLHVGSAGVTPPYGDALGSTCSMPPDTPVGRHEYYINDAGKQMERFFFSLHCTLPPGSGHDPVPEDGYQDGTWPSWARAFSEFGRFAGRGPCSGSAIGGTERIGRAATDGPCRSSRVNFDSWVSESVAA